MPSAPFRLKLALLGFWIGVASLFSFVVAPAAFAVLPSRELAGNLVSRVLGGVEIIGIAVGLLLIVFSIPGPHTGRWRRAIEISLYAIMTLAMSISHFTVSPRLRGLRSQVAEEGPQPSLTDTARQTFDLLHRLSVGLLAFDLVVALVALAFLTWWTSNNIKSHASV